MSKEYRNLKAKLQKQKNMLSWICIVVLVAQMFLYGNMVQINKEFSNDLLSMGNTQKNYYETLVSDIIRPQQRLSLNSIRQSWMQYMSTNEELELLKKTDGKYVFRNQLGKEILYDPLTMTKLKTNKSYYSIIDKASNNLLLENARPQWNMETIEYILNIIATPVKTFGEKGDILIYDVSTGEVIIDNAAGIPPTKEIMQADGKRNILLYYKHPNNKNPEQVKLVVENLMTKSDSQRISQMTSLFYEPNIKDMSKINDFDVYPFGEYKRSFIEKIILPYDSIGIEGLDMQLGIAIRSHEQEIFAAYKGLDTSSTNLFEKIKTKNEINNVYPIASIFLSIIIMIVCIFILKSSLYQCSLYEKKKDEKV